MRPKYLAALLFAVIIAGGAHGFAWRLGHEKISPPDVRAMRSLSFSPYTRNQNPLTGAQVSQEQIASDVQAALAVAQGIRTYSVTGGLELAAVEAAKIKRFRLTLGAWISNNDENNRLEIDTAIKIANDNKSVVAVMAGNETLLRKDKTAVELIAYLKDVRKRVKKNTEVSTSETWDIWLKHPELAEAVDFISVHILPYWEGIHADNAVAYALNRYDEIQKTFPDKKIVIGEFGWPSQGYNLLNAVPNPLTQAKVIRNFITEATERKIEYNIIEAFDQPWKTAEGAVGAYWGLMNADRQLKFSLEGLVEKTDTRIKATAALALGALLTLIGLYRRRPTIGHATAYALAANAMGASMVAAAWWPFEAYMNLGTWIMWTVGVLAIIPLAAITLAKVHEIAEVVLGHAPSRLLYPNQRRLIENPPMVSIQIPAYKEQPDMLMATMDAAARLDYPNFEVLVIVNNTPDERYWKPIEKHCLTLGPRFKFVFLPKIEGFKAGALNKAMEQVDKKAEILALIDADYVVGSNWLKDLTPSFADPKVAMVQAPQDHRDGSMSLFKRMMNWEYAGFFDIGMIQRNEDDAIVAHGTMLMVRRSAFDQAGGWLADTICEDAELGLRLFEIGYSAQYTNVRYGWGVLPDTFKAFKTQRHRWAYGAVQIIKKHGGHMLPWKRTLTPEQKFHYTTGWFYWLSDALGVLMAALNLAWAPVVILADMMVPTVPMALPILTAFVVNIFHSLLLYRVRVKAKISNTLLAAVAAMSLQMTVAKAVFEGFIRDGLPFVVTAKGGGAKKKSSGSVAMWETVTGLLLLCAASALHLTNTGEVVEIDFFAVTLAIQSVPFLSALIMRLAELQAARREPAAPLACDQGNAKSPAAIQQPAS